MVRCVEDRGEERSGDWDKTETERGIRSGGEGRGKMMRIRVGRGGYG